MAVTATLVFAGHSRLRYLISADGAGSATITTTASATPDLQTDSLSGPIKNASKAFANGFGQLAAGALTQAQSRAIWLSDGPNIVAVAGNLNVPTIQARLTERSGVGLISVDANVDGSGHPTVIVTASDVCTAYLDVVSPGAI